MLLAAGAASAQSTLRVVMHSDLKILDPIWTTAYITRNHGYMVYDTLFAMDAKLKIKPQMVDTWTISDDKLTCTFTLRDGLELHDGQPVTAEDCIASLKRWGARDGMGQKLMQFVRELAGRRRQDLPARAEGAVRPGARGAGQAELEGAVHHAQARRRDADPDKQIDDFTGSGPFIFKKDEWKPGEKVVYVRTQIQAAPRAAVGPGRRQGRQGRPGRMGRHSRRRRPRSTR